MEWGEVPRIYIGAIAIATALRCFVAAVESEVGGHFEPSAAGIVPRRVFKISLRFIAAAERPSGFYGCEESPLTAFATRSPDFENTPCAELPFSCG